MSERNTGWIAGVGITVVVVVIGALWHVSAYNQGQRQQREQAANYQVANPADTTECASKGSDFDRFACLVELISAEQEQERARSDLNAQQDMATWALALLWVSVIGVFVSGVGIWLVYANLVALEKQSSTTEQISQKTTKAYVSVEDCRVIWPDEKDKRTRTILNFKNSGQTPALNMKVALFESHKHETIPTWSRVQDKYPFGAVPGGEEREYEFTVGGTSFSDMMFYWEEGASIGPSIRGAVFYEDIYGRLYRSSFSFLRECVAGGEDDPRRLGGETPMPHFSVTGVIFEEAPEEYQPSRQSG